MRNCPKLLNYFSLDLLWHFILNLNNEDVTEVLQARQLGTHVIVSDNR